MDPNAVTVPLWLVQSLFGILAAAICGGLGIGVKLVLGLQSLREHLLGVDGKKGRLEQMDDQLETLDARQENVERDLGDLRLRMTEDRGRLERVEEEVERFRGFAA